MILRRPDTIYCGCLVWVVNIGFRSIDLDSWSLLDILDKIQAGDISFQCGCRKEEQEEKPKVDIQDSGSCTPKEAIKETAGIGDEEYACALKEGKEETGL